MARILFCLSNSILVNGKYKIASFPEQLINELKNVGNDVLVFNPREFNKSCFCSKNQLKDNVSEEDLRQKIIKFSPQLIITFNNAIYAKLLEITDCPVVVWNADLPFLWNQVDLIKANLDRYIFFSFSEQPIKATQKLIGFTDNQSHCVPGATSLHARDVSQIYNISFIGTLFSTDESCVNLIHKYSGSDILIKIMSVIEENPFCSQEDILKLIPDDAKLRQDILSFSADKYPNFFSCQKRVQTLLNVADLGLALYGTVDWLKLANYLPIVAASFHNEMVYSAQQNEDIYNASKIAINIHHCQSKLSMSWRVPDVMATNACLLTDYSPFIADSFKNYVKLPMYTNSFEARDLAQKLLKDDVWRQEIVVASQRAIDAEWRWHHRFKQMEDILNITLFNKQNGTLQMLEPSILPPQPISIAVSTVSQTPVVKTTSISHPSVSAKNKLCKLAEPKYCSKFYYKIWKHFNKRIKVAQEYKKRHPVFYKIWKHLGKKLLKKGIIQ